MTIRNPSASFPFPNLSTSVRAVALTTVDPTDEKKVLHAARVVLSCALSVNAGRIDAIGIYLIFHTKNDPIIQSSIEDLYIEYLGHQKYNGAFLNAMLMLCWAQLLRHHEQDMDCFLTRDHGAVSITAIIDYLNTNYRTVTLSEAAEHFGFSQPHFSTLIKESTGQTFLKIIKSIKLNQACRALKETNLSISAICEVVGYENPEHFMRTFKKEYGITPSEYRKAN